MRTDREHGEGQHLVGQSEGRSIALAADRAAEDGDERRGKRAFREQVAQQIRECERRW